MGSRVRVRLAVGGLQGRVATRHSPLATPLRTWRLGPGATVDSDASDGSRKLLASRETRDALRRVGEGSRTGKGGSEKAQGVLAPLEANSHMQWHLPFTLHIAKPVPVLPSHIVSRLVLGTREGPSGLGFGLGLGGSLVTDTGGWRLVG